MNISSKLDPQALELLGLKPKDLTVYTSLLQLGSAPLRKISEETSLSRGTVHDTLKRLMDLGLVRYLDAKKHRYFTAEDPQKLRGLATRKEVRIQEVRADLDSMIPQLRDLVGIKEHRPSVRYFEGSSGVRDLLEDVLLETKKTRTKTYRVYSSSGVRDLIAAAWPGYNVKRKRVKVHVKAIAIGSGGETHGLDERKWLTAEVESPMYSFIYGSKTAYVGMDDRSQLFGVMIDDKAISTTQRMVFDSLWRTL